MVVFLSVPPARTEEYTIHIAEVIIDFQLLTENFLVTLVVICHKVYPRYMTNQDHHKVSQMKHNVKCLCQKNTILNLKYQRKLFIAHNKIA